jgi:hypothetical protein
VLSAEVDGVALPQQGVDLELVDGRLHLRVREQVLEVAPEVVADSDVPRLPLPLRLHQRPPALPPHFPVALAAGLLLVHSRPVDDHQVQVLHAQPLEHAVDGQPGRIKALLPGRDLAGDEQLAAVDLHLLQHCPNHLLVPVDGGSVDVRVARLERPPHSVRAVLSPQLVSAVADAGDLVSRGQLGFGAGVADHQRIYIISLFVAIMLGKFLKSCLQRDLSFFRKL